MDRQLFRRTLSGTGLLYDGREAGDRRYLCSCFSLIEPTLFVTAAHEIESISPERLWVVHLGGPPPEPFTRVHRIEWVPEADLAVFVTDAPQAKWAAPFQKLKYAADFGEEVCSFGYPAQNVMPRHPLEETARFFRGAVQRPFIFEQGIRRYAAFELSFPCPPGLSGGPVFLAEDPRTVIGVVTGNFEAYTLLNKEEDEIHPGEKIHREVRSVITYGVAANIIAAVPMIQTILSRCLPDPEPEINL